MKTCLLVDDSRIVRRVALQAMESFGFRCAEANDGVQALEACRAAMPDLVLLDRNMPVMNGLDCLRQLRREPGGQDVVVIVCSSAVTPAEIREAINAGADEYVMKPFDSDIIRSKLIETGMLEESLAA